MIVVSFFQHLCPELTDENDGFCYTTIFGSVEGTLPLNQDGIVYSGEVTKAGVIVKLGILSFLTHSIIFAGTITGQIGKVCAPVSLMSVDLNTSLVWGSFSSSMNACGCVQHV